MLDHPAWSLSEVHRGLSIAQQHQNGLKWTKITPKGPSSTKTVLRNVVHDSMPCWSCFRPKMLFSHVSERKDFLDMVRLIFIFYAWNWVKICKCEWRAKVWVSDSRAAPLDMLSHLKNNVLHLISLPFLTHSLLSLFPLIWSRFSSCQEKGYSLVWKKSREQ